MKAEDCVSDKKTTVYLIYPSSSSIHHQWIRNSPIVTFLLWKPTLEGQFGGPYLVSVATAPTNFTLYTISLSLPYFLFAHLTTVGDANY